VLGFNLVVLGVFRVQGMIKEKFVANAIQRLHEKHKMTYKWMSSW
jgi:hypothetical protein